MTGDSNYQYDVYAGAAGGSSRLVSHQPFPAHSLPCRVFDILASGSYLCQDNNQRSYVEAATGAWLWDIGCTLEACLDNGGLLAPDATHVAAMQPHSQDPSHTTILRRHDLSRVHLGDQFVPDGWFDSATVAVDNGFKLEYVSLSAPTQARAPSATTSKGA